MAEKSPKYSSLDRIVSIDVLRTIAIISMISWHVLFIVWWNNPQAFSLQTPVLVLWQKSTLILFLALTGISFTISQKKDASQIVEEVKKSHTSRIKQWWQLCNTRISPSTTFMNRKIDRVYTIAMVAIGVNIVSVIFVPLSPIYFGVLHCIAVSYALLLLWKRMSILLIVAAITSVSWFFLPIKSTSTYLFLPFGIYSPWFSSVDYVPILPWFAVVAFGRCLGWFFVLQNPRQTLLPKWQHILLWPGRNSLLLYCIHMPIIITIFYIYYFAYIIPN